MDNPLVPVRRRWIIPLAVAAAGAGLVVLLGAIHLEGRRDRARLRTRALLEEALTRSGRRPVLRGEPIPGNAWDDYLKAATALKQAPDCWDRLPCNPGDVPSPDLFLILRKHAGIARLVREGTRRERSEYPLSFDFDSIQAEGIHPLARRLVILLILTADDLAESGRGQEAAECVLDACQFLLDVGTNTPAEFSSEVAYAWEFLYPRLQSTLLATSLGPSAGADLDGELAVLQARPSGFRSAVRNLTLSQGLGISKPSRSCSCGATQSWYARFDGGLSEYHAGLEALLEADALRSRAEACADMDWPGAQAVLSQLEIEVQRSRNSHFRTWGANLGSRILNRERARLARIILLRTALGFRLTGRIPDLPDPFGDRIRRRLEPAALVLWSVGGDGRCDDGKGDFAESPEGHDIVLRLAR